MAVVLSLVETLVACLAQRAMRDDMDMRRPIVSRLCEPEKVVDVCEGDGETMSGVLLINLFVLIFAEN